ncbi:YihY/virulence factor BrkB family protein [Aerococcus mictus]|uniref:YihY/virulence factor BrkB family protein n=1 Tax=Aerococcus tenax TaxID=3078812 RepID=A0A329PN11_9LACT|nr:YihY/virulence factor BrkB family protein [Aerococcus urinae]KAA9290761.1 YihY/virulence factor BrkB family protein [Aerococcus mictus]KAA9298406.1 YihY/virulence factor BrkB family protein [Aerococcus tenax]RAV69716.1 YihY/virulence factor BrkB family protein [Aerococcus loyolae]KAA9239219.1 YihY/virulence factor BrkB family protein [Aerococcus urinae]PKY83776.1 YihY/virulence factor BrkB family protein [Aerococcus mictus]
MGKTSIKIGARPVKKIKEVLVPIASQSVQDASIGSSAAELAYYALLAIFPMLLLVANIIPLLPFDSAQAVEWITAILPNEIEPLLIPTLESYLDSTSAGSLSINTILVIWSSSAGFSALQRVLNRVYGNPDHKNAVITRIASFLIAFLLVLTVGVFSLFFVFGETLLRVINNFVPLPLGFVELLLGLKWPVLLISVFILMLFIYIVVPNQPMTLKYALPGSVTAAVMVLLISSLFGVYVQFAGGSSVQNGTIGVFIALMLYLYLNGMALIVGALVNTIYYRYKHADTYLDQRIKYEVSLSPDFPHLNDKEIAYSPLKRASKAIQAEALQKND